MSRASSGVAGDLARQHRDPEAREQLLALVFVKIHRLLGRRSGWLVGGSAVVDLGALQRGR